MSFGIKSYPLV